MDQVLPLGPPTTLTNRLYFSTTRWFDLMDRTTLMKFSERQHILRQFLFQLSSNSYIFSFDEENDKEPFRGVLNTNLLLVVFFSMVKLTFIMKLMTSRIINNFSFAWFVTHSKSDLKRGFVNNVVILNKQYAIIIVKLCITMIDTIILLLS